MQSPALSVNMLGRLALSVVAEAKRDVPRKTGNLGRSIHRGAVSAEYAEVRASAGYAAFVEFGTRPHLIVPVRARALAWPAQAGGARLTGSARKSTQRGGNGGMRFARAVHHPGTRPNPFMERAFQRAVSQAHLEEVVVAAWNAGG